jgi:TrmH family RNA methyltransferase
MKIIESRDHPLVKTWRKWAQAQGRGGVPVLLDSAHVCESWLARFGAPDHALFDVARLNDPRLARLIAAVPVARAVALPAQVMVDLGRTPSDQGVRFVVQPPAPRVPLTLTAGAVLLDRVQDPGNVGTILRSAAAAGVAQICLSPGCAAAWSSKVLRSGQGAHFALDIIEHADLPALAGASKVPLVVTTLEQAEDLYLTALPTEVLWVFGHEGQGVSPALLAQAQYRVRIDHERAAIESLNVSMAATLCLFEHRRQHRYQTV